MKQLKFLMSVCLIAFLTVMVTLLSSCGARLNPTNNNGDAVESGTTLTVEQQQAVIDPSFINAEQAFGYYQDLAEDWRLDSIIMNMPERTFLNVVSVCEQNYTKFKRRDIVHEYMKNRQVYDALPVNNAPSAKANSAPEGPSGTGEVLVSSEHRDTIINGEKHRIDKQLVKYE